MMSEGPATPAAATGTTQLEDLVDALPVGVAIFDRDLRYLRLNEQLARINGFPVSEHLGRRIDEVVPDLDPEVYSELRRALERGEPLVGIEVGGETPAEPGARRYWRCTFFPVRNTEGDVAAVGAAVIEITDQRRAEDAQRGLEAQLAQERAVLDQVFERVPVGLCLMWGRELRFGLVNRRFYDLLPNRGDVEGKLGAEVYPDAEPLIRTLTDPVFDTGDPIIVEDFPLSFQDEDGTPGAERYYNASLVPVSFSEGTVDGVLGVFDETTDEVKRRRALERELSEQHEVTALLQRGLMPEDLPQLERIELAVRFVPADERTRVGGDFYDVFDAHDSLFIVLGDVAGKGAEAASTTAMFRNMIRALALYERRPAQILERLREALLARASPPMCTIVCAVVERPRSARRVTIAAAAHPLPLLVSRRGNAREVGGENPLLRLRKPGEMVETTERLRRGDRLLFYTDGLTDAQAPQRQLTTDELLGAISGRENLALEQLLDNVLGWACGPVGKPRDDIAVLAMERR
jgi:PAS domain S-box-containing protein